jgi:hypothetical protein
MAQRDDGGTVRGCGDTQVDASQSADRNVNEVLRAYFETFSTSYEVTPLGRFAGIGVLGKDARGNAAVARAYSVGDRIVFAWVSANGSHLNMPDAERFLNSLRLSVPWRVRALANVGVTVALPAFAAPTPPRAPQQGNVEFVLGGSGEIKYWVATEAFDAPDTRPRDVVLREYEHRLARGSQIASSVSVVEDGTPGRDVLLTGVRYVRLRLLAGPATIYLMSMQSKIREALYDEDATRFFSSLRWYR